MQRSLHLQAHGRANLPRWKQKGRASPCLDSVLGEEPVQVWMGGAPRYLLTHPGHLRERYWESLKGVVDGNRLIVEDQNGYLQTWQFSFPSKDRLNLEGMLPATTATYRRRRPQPPPLQRR